MVEKSKDDSPEEALQSELKQAEELGNAIAERGREITQIGQRMADQAKATQQVAQFLPAQYDREQLIDDWYQVNRLSTIALDQLSHNIEPLISSSGSISTAYVSSTGTFTEGNLLPLNPPERHPFVISAIKNLNNIFVQSDIKNEALAMINVLQLDISVPGKKKPSESLEVAHRAYEQPLTNTNPVSTSLIPMRECIQTIIVTAQAAEVGGAERQGG